MHRARLVGLLFLFAGAAVLAAVFLGPAWLPLPRIFVIAGPGGVLLGLAMMLRPGAPLRPDEEFDFEDWYDEASLTDKILYSAAGLGGLGIGLLLYFKFSFWTEFGS